MPKRTLDHNHSEDSGTLLSRFMHIEKNSVRAEFNKLLHQRATTRDANARVNSFVKIDRGRQT